MTLIEDAVGSGCRRAVACETLEISLRTYQRWTREGDSCIEDGRKDARRVAPANKLSEEERTRIKQLEKELLRKDTALAEAAARIILRTKAQAIWGDPEED